MFHINKLRESRLFAKEANAYLVTYIVSLDFYFRLFLIKEFASYRNALDSFWLLFFKLRNNFFSGKLSQEVA